ncbi:MAG: hypothetical protein AAFO91_13425 [Bacteroidota bacterium]
MCNDQDGFSVDRFEVFQRLPCAHSSASTGSMSSDFRNSFNTCPSVCCTNQMAMNDLSYSSHQSNYGQSNSPYTNYLSNPLMSQANVNFFCPYYYVKFPGLNDLSHSVRGCCKQTACYHKSLVSVNCKLNCYRSNFYRFEFKKISQAYFRFCSNLSHR